MIRTIFPINILVKDYEKSDEWNSTISAFIKTHFTKAITEKGSYFAAADEDIDVFTEENMTAFPELRELFNMFIDGFYELSNASSSGNEIPLTREEITKKIHKDLGRLPLMRNGDQKNLHTHNEASAYAIFYLSDVENEKEGGQLILHDPTFNTLRYFTSQKTVGIETKKNRLIVAPTHIWHEVTRYTGVDERLTIVLNLHI
jgi:Rps23 Pro-64 3,4-dihydroxylase Tpa1-like proline 4-hydroxylase